MIKFIILVFFIHTSSSYILLNANWNRKHSNSRYNITEKYTRWSMWVWAFYFVREFFSDSCWSSETDSVEYKTTCLCMHIDMSYDMNHSLRSINQWAAASLQTRDVHPTLVQCCHRLWRWSNIKPTLGERLVLAGLPSHLIWWCYCLNWLTQFTESSKSCQAILWFS